jgi:phosphatidylglycerol:prolipoprotein diacylglycerol transferase
MLVGSRLLHWWTHPTSQGREFSHLLTLDFRGFSLYGGLLLAGLAGVVCCGLARVNLWELADCVAIALSIGIVIIRLGCFANGCCFGVETDLSWGVVYPQGSPAQLHHVASNPMAIFHDSRAVHPTQIYEMLAAGVAALLACMLLHGNFPSGVPFLAAAIVFTSFRWVIEPLRAHNPTLVTEGWTYRLLYGMLVAIGTVALVGRLRAKKKSDREEARARIMSQRSKAAGNQGIVIPLAAATSDRHPPPEHQSPHIRRQRAN